MYVCIHKNNAPPSYHHSGSVEIQALGHMMYGYKLLVISGNK